MNHARAAHCSRCNGSGWDDVDDPGGDCCRRCQGVSGRDAEPQRASCPAPKLLATEAGAVLVAWLPGYDDPIAWWATDDREAFLDALVSCAIDQRRAQTDPADEQPTDHEISREFRAAMRIEAVKP